MNFFLKSKVNSLMVDSLIADQFGVERLGFGVNRI